jgi:hypothetical protein
VEGRDPPVIWLLSCFGLTWIVTRSVLFAPLRARLPKPVGTTPFWGTLVRCPQCFGFWVGVLHALVGVAPVGVGSGWQSVLCAGFVSSGACYLGKLLCDALGQGPLEEEDAPDGLPEDPDNL